MGATSPRPSLFLASASPRRQQLLEQIGLVPDLIEGVDADETLIKGELPREAVLRLAHLKADAAEKRGGGYDFLLAADTIVACGRRILGKPSGEEEARAMLQLLSGRRHRVLTALVLIAGGERRFRVVETRVLFKRLSLEELSSYLLSREWEGKAGAYAIQGRAGAFVKGLEGSYSNVVGLPLHETANLLVGAGYPLYSGDG